MRVLITGTGGFIGRYLARRLGQDGGLSIAGTYRSQAPEGADGEWHRVELADAAELHRVFRLDRPDVVVHLAAMADVGTAERERSAATAVNVKATSEIARLCALYDSRLVFVSTEYVFDGSRGFYREDDAPDPTTHYGRTKLEGEREVERMAGDWCVVRTSIVYGWPAPGRRNFVPWLLERLRAGQSYEGSPEVLRTPVYVGHLVDGIYNLAKGNQQGIQHIAGRDWVSMYDFALAVADGFEEDPAPVVQATTTTGPTNPDRLGLDSGLTMRRLGLPHHGLAEGIAAMRADERPGPGSPRT